MKEKEKNEIIEEITEETKTAKAFVIICWILSAFSVLASMYAGAVVAYDTGAGEMFIFYVMIGVFFAVIFFGLSEIVSLLRRQIEILEEVHDLKK